MDITQRRINNNYIRRNNRGLFTINGVYSETLNNSWVDESAVPTSNNFGYYDTGSSQQSYIYRIDMSNDTSVLLGNLLPYNKDSQCALGNINYGYWGGGRRSPGPQNDTSIYRIDYSQDSSNLSPRANLSNSPSTGSKDGLSSINYGYFMGSQPPGTSNVERLDFSNDYASLSPRNTTNSFTYRGNASTSDFGWLAGGYFTAPTVVYSRVDRTDFANDTQFELIRGPLNNPRYHTGSVFNNKYAWFTGGGPGPYTYVDRIDYSNDTITASPRQLLNDAREGQGGSYNSNFGYLLGGNGPVSSVERMDFENDLVSLNPRARLVSTVQYVNTNVRFENYPRPGISTDITNEIYGTYWPGTWPTSPTGFSTTTSANYDLLPQLVEPVQIRTNPPRTDVGYFIGGYFPSPSYISDRHSIVDRIDFSNDTNTASPRGSLSDYKYGAAAAGSSDYGYNGGGINRTSSISFVDKIDYSSDTAQASALGGSLTVQRYYLGAASNSSYTWFAAGYTPANVSTSVDRLEHAADLSSTSPRGPLTLARMYLTGVGNQNYGWFIAGSNGPVTASYSTVDRVDYSNDTPTTSPRGTLTGNTYGTAATGNADYGWVGTGTIQRIEYANDLVTASPRASITFGKTHHAATGNGNYGWFGGGTPNQSIVTRLDFSNDTENAVRRGDLSFPRWHISASSAAANALPVSPPAPPAPLATTETTGYFFQGYDGSVNTSDTSRISFANDTVQTSTRGNLTFATNGLEAAGNSDYAYIGGNPINKFDYFNDTALGVLKTNFTTSRGSTGAVSSKNYAYFAGGGPTSVIDRIDYSSDMGTPIQRGFLESTKYDMATSGNNNFGYIVGGINNSVLPNVLISKIERISYSNDDVVASPRGGLFVARHHVAGTGNSNFGYYGGGFTNFPGTTNTSIVERFTYANDTTAASPRAPLTIPRSILSATGSENYGYFGGGYLAPNTNYSTIDRIDYSNDTVASPGAGPLAVAKRSMAHTRKL